MKTANGIASGKAMGVNVKAQVQRVTLRTVIAAAAALLAACSTVERSRNLGDPAVPAKALAAQVCSNCHGLDGNSTSPNFPRLAAQPAVYLTTQLKDFRAQNRSDPAGFEYMWGLSRHLTDEQIDGLAAYYAGQQAQANRAADPQLVAKGRALFESGVPEKNIPPCSACHGAEAQGNETFPRLADQHADYIMKQLLVFQRTDQRPAGVVMRTIAHDLTPENIVAVADFLQSFHAH